jgi:hypothetical protein
MNNRKNYKSILFAIASLLFQTLVGQQNDIFQRIVNKEIAGMKHFVEGFREIASQTNNPEILEKIPSFESNTEDFQFNFTILDQGDKSLYKGTIAIAFGTTIENKINIVIDINNWNKLSVVEKFSTIIHELCHDALNLKHTDSDPRSLMHPTAQPKTFEELTMMTLRMLENYKYGLIPEFDLNEIYIHNNSIESKTKTYKKSILKDLKFYK